ncbi:hypothetical protein PVAG01_08270 [Phlyctema vagabunda]|uniref:Uncharacterized protein n=1 Tax=Phlyctema vagabunda TaxID=108571 RepID=A0ABR4P944_9HELO
MANSQAPVLSVTNMNDLKDAMDSDPVTQTLMPVVSSEETDEQMVLDGSTFEEGLSATTSSLSKLSPEEKKEFRRQKELSLMEEFKNGLKNPYEVDIELTKELVRLSTRRSPKIPRFKPTLATIPEDTDISTIPFDQQEQLHSAQTEEAALDSMLLMNEVEDLSIVANAMDVAESERVENSVSLRPQKRRHVGVFATIHQILEERTDIRLIVGKKK